MSERKNHLSIDGGQVKEDDHVVSYKPIPESESEFRTSKSNLAKSKEKLSPDGAEEKLLSKEEEAKIVTRVDMADAKYVVGDHRNGDAKIELDANKRQFSGLTKEELLKYAEDPFWVNLRWFMFVLFWAMWLAMLAGAITIIIKAPKCAPPPPKTWYQKGPLVDMEALSIEDTQTKFEMLKSDKVQGIFIDAPTYEVLDSPDILANFKEFFTKAKDYGIKVIVDLTPNYVSVNHTWFKQSCTNRSGEYGGYFLWANSTEFLEGNMALPNNWTSTLNKSAWEWNADRNEYYLNQYGENYPDLDFKNLAVVEQFNNVIKFWMEAGAGGIRLNKARQLLVSVSSGDETPNSGKGSAPGSVHTNYLFWRRKHTSDLPGLDPLFAQWSKLVDETAGSKGETVFTLLEEGDRAELYLLERNLTSLRPPSAAPLRARDVTTLADQISRRVNTTWPAIQLKATIEDDTDVELAAFSLLLPAAPVLSLQQLLEEENSTYNSEYLSHLAALRDDATVAHGEHHVVPVPHQSDAEASLIACARAKIGHTGYLAVYNPTSDALRANLTSVQRVPATVTIHLMSHNVKLLTNYTTGHAEKNDNVLVPAKSTIVLSYVPVSDAEN